MRCCVTVAKDSEQRGQSARDLASELRWIASRRLEPPPVATTRGGLAAGVGGGAGCARAGAGRLGTLARPDGRARPESGNRPFRLDPPVGRDWVALETAHIAVPPDGRRLAMSVEAGGKRHVWIREICSLAAQRLDDTEGAVRRFGPRMASKWPSPLMAS